MGVLQDRSTKYASLICMNINSNWEESGLSWIMSSLQQPFVSGVVDSFRSLMPVLYTISCNISHMLLSTGLKCGEFGGHSWGGINSWVSFHNHSIAFQASIGRVETLSRWGRKRLHHFAANLFRKRYKKFHQNRRSFIGDITKKHFGLYFPDTVYIVKCNVSECSVIRD